MEEAGKETAYNEDDVCLLHREEEERDGIGAQCEEKEATRRVALVEERCGYRAKSEADEDNRTQPAKLRVRKPKVLLHLHSACRHHPMVEVYKDIHGYDHGE